MRFRRTVCVALMLCLLLTLGACSRTNTGVLDSEKYKPLWNMQQLNSISRADGALVIDFIDAEVNSRIFTAENGKELKMRLDGYGIFVKDMGKMIRFYRDVLGFEIKEPENTENVYLVKDGTLFLLYGRDDFETMTHRKYEYLKGVNAHTEMALYVDTFEEVDLQYARAVSCGAAPLLEPETEPWGQRTCFIADPEGNIIEIGSWNKPYEEKDL